MSRFFAWTILLLGSAGILGLVENRLFWGYWLSRPSLSDPLNSATSLIGASALWFDANGNPVIIKDRSEAFEADTSFCRKSSDRNECLDGSIIHALREKGLLDAQTPQVSRRLLEQVWPTIAPDLWHPKVSPRYRATGIPINGLAVHFHTQKGERLLLTRRTSEVADDRYAYLEALLALSPRLRLQKQIHFFYEIAGLEGIGWPHFTALSFLVLVILSIAWRTIRWLLRRTI
jgi:hypothetical protein